MRGPNAARTPVTAVIPIGGERAFVTYEPRARLDARRPRRLRPARPSSANDELRPRAGTARSRTSLVGDRRRALRRRAPGGARARAGAVREPRRGGAADRDERPRGGARTRERVPTAVVTCGADGRGRASSEGELVDAPAPHVDGTDTTGAGDLLAAAYVWGDWEGCRSSSGCGGRSCMPPSPCGRRPGPPSAATLRRARARGGRRARPGESCNSIGIGSKESCMNLVRSPRSVAAGACGARTSRCSPSRRARNASKRGERSRCSSGTRRSAAARPQRSRS